MKGAKRRMKLILAVAFLKNNLLRVFSDIFHNARVHENLCVTGKKIGKIFH